MKYIQLEMDADDFKSDKKRDHFHIDTLKKWNYHESVQVIYLNFCPKLPDRYRNIKGIIVQSVFLNNSTTAIIRAFLDIFYKLLQECRTLIFNWSGKLSVKPPSHCLDSSPRAQSHQKAFISAFSLILILLSTPPSLSPSLIQM